MEIQVAVKWTVFAITLALLVVAIYLIPQIVYKNLVAPIFRVKILIILLITLGHTSLNVYNIIMEYGSYVSRWASFLAQVTIYVICLFNVHILQVFSLLNPNITQSMITVWTIVVSLIAFSAIWSSIWTLGFLNYSYIPNVIIKYNTLSSTAFTVFAVLYDNIQGAYLIYLVLINKKKRGAELSKVLNGLVTSLIVVSLMDWFGIAIFSIATFIPSVNSDMELYNSFLIFADTYTGIHGSAMIYVFKQLTEFTFVDSKIQPKKKEPSSKKANGKGSSQQSKPKTSLTKTPQ